MSAIEQMISRFTAVWGDPPSAHRGMYLAEIRRSMLTYPDRVISKAADIAIDTRVAWPRPAELRAIALRAAVTVRQRVPEMAPLIKTRTPEELARAEQIMADFRRAMMDTPTCLDTPHPASPTTPALSSGNGSNVVRLAKRVI